MDLNDLINLYRSLQREHSGEAPKHLSELFRKAKEQHKRDFEGQDHEQSWRAFKGKNVEKLVRHMPDDDFVCLEKSLKVVAVLSIKVTLRERIAQSGYWKLKLASQKLTQHIHSYFITLDEDGTLKSKDPMKKGRAIVEADLDGSYVLSPNPLEESSKVRLFERFVGDLKSRVKDFHS